MPIYEFKCTKCDISIEKLLNIHECNSMQVCICGDELTRVMSASHGYVKGTENHCFN